MRLLPTRLRILHWLAKAIGVGFTVDGLPYGAPAEMQNGVSGSVTDSSGP